MGNRNRNRYGDHLVDQGSLDEPVADEAADSEEDVVVEDNAAEDETVDTAADPQPNDAPAVQAEAPPTGLAAAGPAVGQHIKGTGINVPRTKLPHES